MIKHGEVDQIAPPAKPSILAGDLSDLAQRLKDIVAELDARGLSLAAALVQNALDAIGPPEGN